MAKRAQRRRLRARRLLQPLLEQLDSPGASDETQSFLRSVQQWLASNLHAFSAEERRANGLEEWAAIRLGDYPTEYSDFDSAVELARLRDVPPSSISEVAMSIGTMFWDGVTVWSERQCPRGDGPLRVLQEPSNPAHLGYTCDLCGWAEDQNGTEWPLDGELVPATTEALQRRGLLLRSV